MQHGRISHPARRLFIIALIGSCLFSQAALAAPGGRITNLSSPTGPDFDPYVNVSIASKFEWDGLSNPDSSIIAEIFVYSSIQQGAVVFVDAGGPPYPPSGSYQSPVVANVNGHVDYLCILQIMTIDDVEVSVGFQDVLGEYCASNFTAYDTLHRNDTPIPALDRLGLALLALLLGGFGLLSHRRTSL